MGRTRNFLKTKDHYRNKNEDIQSVNKTYIIKPTITSAMETMVLSKKSGTADRRIDRQTERLASTQADRWKRETYFFVL